MRAQLSSRTRRHNASIRTVEPLESRLLLTVNAWKAAISGFVDDASKWSLGHAPTSIEDVAISVPGTYTVTARAAASFNSLKVGGATGTQTLTLNAQVNVAKAFSLGAGDAINLTGGRLISLAPAGTNDQIDGTITLNGSATKQSILNVGSANLIGAGSIFFATGGSASTSENNLEGSTYSLGSSLKLHGKGGSVTRTFTNKGTINVEGGSADSWYLNSFANQGTFNSPNGEMLRFSWLNNAAGHTMNITGGSTVIQGNQYNNSGTINWTNVKVTYDMTFKSAGVMHRVNSPVFFAGFLDGQNKPFVTSDSAGPWTFAGGTLMNGSYNPTATGALKIDLTAPQGTLGALKNVTLTGDFNIPSGFTLSASSGNITLASGKRIILNGNATAPSKLTLFGATLAGSGEVLFNTANGVNANIIGGNTYTIGSGITVHGKSGTISGGATNNGVILADTPGQGIQLMDLTNNGNIIAAPGTINSLGHFTQKSTGAMTVGIGGNTPGTNMGVFNFKDVITAPVFAGLFNAVLLSTAIATAGKTFPVGTFAKTPVGSFGTKNLDAGDGIAFDYFQAPTGFFLGGKTASSFASLSPTSFLLSLIGTAGNDTITSKQQLAILYLALNGKVEVFLDRLITAMVINALSANDKVTITGSRGVSVSGGAGNDSIFGGSGNDWLDGGEGDDLLEGLGGNDIYHFVDPLANQTDVVFETPNSGTDTLDFSAMTEAITANLGSDTLATMHNRTVKDGTAGQFANFENASGGSGNDVITGNAVPNVLNGNAGNDKFFSLGGGIDQLNGGPGTDVIGSADANDVKTNIP